MDSAIEVFGFLVGVSGGLFLIIALLVTLPGRVRRRAARTTSAGAMWFGGPFRSEHGVDTSGLVLKECPVPEVDWVMLAETAEPGRHVGGASSMW
ncbi:hypothetical protein [Streptosporangium lutulentum]|uniref:Uncharacterized protein n=1 Tax=Streptosporangium lutulentum TaxID=1461250 RepID=A0ABT9QTR8_9ACTN|nr:hypothetical protein [Streptosporangium lutulentum]MDP9850140.1 hypothetical protein [Streptosporangium lutulentum]